MAIIWSLFQFNLPSLMVNEGFEKKLDEEAFVVCISCIFWLLKAFCVAMLLLDETLIAPEIELGDELADSKLITVSVSSNRHSCSCIRAVADVVATISGESSALFWFAFREDDDDVLL